MLRSAKLICYFDQITNVTAASKWVQATIWVLKRELPTVDYQNYQVYYHDHYLGSVRESFFNGHYEVIAVALSSDRTEWVPLVPAYCQTTDDQAQKIILSQLPWVQSDAEV